MPARALARKARLIPKAQDGHRAAFACVADRWNHSQQFDTARCPHLSELQTTFAAGKPAGTSPELPLPRRSHCPSSDRRAEKGSGCAAPLVTERLPDLPPELELLPWPGSLPSLPLDEKPCHRLGSF